MNSAQQLHDVGQSLWLDDIARYEGQTSLPRGGGESKSGRYNNSAPPLKHQGT